MNQLGKYILFGSLILFSTLGKAQLSDAIVHIDSLSKEWNSISPDLEDYEKLSLYCDYSSYKKKAVNVLQAIHHYDTLLINELNKSHLNDHVLNRIIRFEHDLTISDFIRHLKHECLDRQEVERRKVRDKTDQDFGITSYSAEREVVENEIVRYIRKVNNKLEHLQKNIHHLDKYIQSGYTNNVVVNL